MQTLFQQMNQRLAQGESLVLVSVEASSGSTPRGEGAMMLVSAQGRIAGTIGGGAVEYRSEQLAREALAAGRSRVERFQLRPNEVQDLGMICGGDVEVSFRYLAGGDEAAIAWAREEEARLTPSGRVYIFGGGHVAQALVPALAAVDFRCVVLEDREDFCRPELFPGVEETRLIQNGDPAAYAGITAEDYVAVMTRGHKDDLTVQAQALKTPAKYIGVIGSRKKTAAVFAKLRDMGYTDADLQRITTPIGLSIKAETPAEIAVSIAAQLIQLRAETK
jgi:xanthine dehydrogenase accessory factor